MYLPFSKDMLTVLNRAAELARERGSATIEASDMRAALDEVTPAD